MILILVLFLITNLVAFYVLLTHHIHMYQLNYYSPKEQMNRLKENRWTNFGRVFGFFVSIFFILTIGNFTHPYSSMVVAIVLNCLSSYLGWERSAKIPLKYTKRVIRLFITTVIVYLLLTSVFVIAFINHSLSLYPMLVAVQALPFLTVYIMMLADFINKPIEKAINQGFINEAKRIIAQDTRLSVIGVTGSYGKTSVKNILKTLLSGDYNVLATPGNYNTTLGVVITIRQYLTPIHDIFVCEMGAKNTGEIKEICDIVHPKYGIITSIGPSHLETFGSMQNIVNTKFELEQSVAKNTGTTLLNYDNDYIRGKSTNSNLLTYSVDFDGSNFVARDIFANEDGSKFTLHINGEDVYFETSLLGKHNILNIIGCIALSSKLGVTNETLVERVKLLKPIQHRQEVIKKPFGLIIDDAYNSNPDGAKSALDTLAMFNMTKIVVTPGMIELGDEFYRRNKTFGEQISKVADLVVLVGENQTKPIQDGLKEKNYDPEKIRIFSNMADALNFAIGFNTLGKKAILIENDLPDNYGS